MLGSPLDLDFASHPSVSPESGTGVAFVRCPGTAGLGESLAIFVLVFHYPQRNPWQGNKPLITIPPNNVGGGSGPAIGATLRTIGLRPKRRLGFVL
jgi:hypothetical protein